MTDPHTIERWFAHVDKDHPFMAWLIDRALRTRER